MTCYSCKTDINPDGAYYVAGTNRFCVECFKRIPEDRFDSMGPVFGVRPKYQILDAQKTEQGGIDKYDEVHSGEEEIRSTDDRHAVSAKENSGEANGVSYHVIESSGGGAFVTVGTGGKE